VTICAARAPPRANRISKQLLRHGHIYGDGKSWTVRHHAWVASQRLADPLAHAALEHMLGHLATLDAQLAAIDGQLERVANLLPGWTISTSEVNRALDDRAQIGVAELERDPDSIRARGIRTGGRCAHARWRSGTAATPPPDQRLPQMRSPAQRRRR
jgi:hypothetical protein